MRKFIILTGFILAMSGCATMDSMTMKNEPTEIQGLKFNTQLSEIPGMTEQNGHYVRENENITIFNVPVKAIYYKFNENRLYEVSYLFEGLYNYNALKENLYNKYGLSAGAKATTTGFWIGDTTILPQNRDVWSGKEVYILLEYNSGKGILIYQYLPILKKMYK